MFGDYVDQIKSPFSDVSAKQQIGIVVAKGTILDGEQKAGEIGGDSTARLLRNARENENIKAVVLYVDSPGGSAFASEVIRQEIKQLKMAGKPVVAAMSTYAASGGYWISASADKIVAAPSTITGSIGVFGMFTTFEDSLDYLGLHVDGVGTTEFTGLSTARTLDPKIERIFQRSVERSYDQFISLVAQKRNLTKEAVDEIAQGRVWTGSTAMELGLVDQLGYIDDAIIVAAELANLTEYDTKNIIPPLDPQEQFIQDILGYVGSFVVKNQSTPANNALISIGKQLISEINILNRFNDPRGLYSICLQCEY
jgi:protease-4